MAWRLVGSVRISPAASELTVGALELPAPGPLAVKVQATDETPFPFGYCLLSYISSYGRELGVIRVWPRIGPCAYVLGQGLRARDPFGVLVIEPRTWNLRWAEAGFSLGVRVLADLAPLLDGPVTVPPGIVDLEGRRRSLSLAGRGGFVDFT